MADWARDRLQAVGSARPGDLSPSSMRAPSAMPLPRSSGLDAALKNEQSDRYELTDHRQARGRQPAARQIRQSVTETVTRSQTVAEDLTLNQREVVLFNLLDTAMKDLNARLEQSIPQYLAPLLR